MKLAQKLLEIKKRVPFLKPNERGFNYDYANPSRVLGVFNPLFNEFGILFTSSVVGTKSKSMIVTSILGDKRKANELRELSKTEILHTVQMTFSFEDVESGEVRTIPWCGTGNNGVEQGFGSALTYAQRYFLLNYFAIPVDKEDPNFIQKIKKEKGTDVEKKDLKTLTSAVSKQMIEALDSKLRTPDQIRTSLSSFKNGVNKDKVEDKLLNL